MIVESVSAGQVISTEEFVRRLGVSAETVRRDLALLEERGVIRRVHGGAAAVADRRVIEPSYTERSIIRHQAKAEIARVAAGLLENGQTVIIDIGTTAITVAQAIPQGFTGTVITGALAPGISWAVLVHCTVVVVLALQSQPLPLGVALAVTPVGSVSVTVMVPVVAAVLAGSSLPTVSE